MGAASEVRYSSCRQLATGNAGQCLRSPARKRPIPPLRSLTNLSQADIAVVRAGAQDIAEGYRFAAHKEKVIDLLMRVTTVSVETTKLVKAIQRAGR